jgi:hypothetical protein
MVPCLAALPNLKKLHIEFHDEAPYPDQPHPPTRSILPSLTSISFHGAGYYLEDLLAQFDAPTFQTFSVTLWDKESVVGFSQRFRVISRAERLRPTIRAMVEFDSWRVLLKFIPSHGFDLAIMSDFTSGEQVESMAVVCREISPLLSHVERLDLYCNHLPSFTNSMDPMHWLEIFRPFTTVKDLYISKRLGQQIATAMQALSSEAAEDILPKLDSLFLEELPQDGRTQLLSTIGTFIASRLLFGHPVSTKQCTASDFDAKS